MSDQSETAAGELTKRVVALEKAMVALKAANGVIEGRLQGAENEIGVLKRRLGEIEVGVIKSGDKVSLICNSEFLTWMTSGGEVKSRPTGSYMPDFQGWKVERR